MRPKKKVFLMKDISRVEGLLRNRWIRAMTFLIMTIQFFLNLSRGVTRTIFQLIALILLRIITQLKIKKIITLIFIKVKVLILVKSIKILIFRQQVFQVPRSNICTTWVTRAKPILSNKKKLIRLLNRIWFFNKNYKKKICKIKIINISQVFKRRNLLSPRKEVLLKKNKVNPQMKDLYPRIITNKIKIAINLILLLSKVKNIKVKIWLKIILLIKPP